MVGFLAAFAAWGGQSFGQGYTRGEVQFKPIGWINDPRAPGQQLLNDDSGAWRAGSFGSPQGILRSNIYNPVPFTLPIVSPGSGAYMISTLISSPSISANIANVNKVGAAYTPTVNRQIYFPADKMKLSDINVYRTASPQPLPTDAAASMADIDVPETLNVEIDDQVLLSSNLPMTSLVPTTGGKIIGYMKKGDEEFRAGRYRSAVEQYKLAKVVGKSTRTRLALFLAELSAADYSYAMAAFYAKTAVRYMPKLMAIKLNLEGFYADSKDYKSVADRLSTFVEKNVYNDDALICKTFVSWFSGDVAGAQVALSKALGLAGNDEKKKADIKAIWDGMVASGKVTGVLTPTLPPPLPVASQPAEEPTSAPVPATQEAASQPVSADTK